MKPEMLKEYIKQVSKERALSIDVVCDAVEQALLQAMRKTLTQYEEPQIRVDPNTGELSLWITKLVVPRISMHFNTEISLREAQRIIPDIEEGQSILVPVKDAKISGRIAAQQAHQFIQMRLRDAERCKVNDNYIARVGEIVTGTVERIEKDYFGLRLNDGIEVALLRKHVIGQARNIKIRDQMKAMIFRVDNGENVRGPIVQVSRTEPKFVEGLFYQEVPELSDGVVEIVAIARTAGLRTKIAVRGVNGQKDIDPVGACVGQKGSRVQQVVRELETEKVDVIAWSDDPVKLITDAINSGSADKQGVVVAVRIVREREDDAPGRAIVTVKRDNIAVALGKKGVNVDLSNALSGYRIEVVLEGEDIRRDVNEVTRDYLIDFLTQLEVQDEIKTKIAESNFNSVEALSKAQPANLLHLVDGNRPLVARLIAKANEYFEEMRKLTRHTANPDSETPAKDGAENVDKA